MKRNLAKKELPLHIHDNDNGLDYTLHGDYYLPDIENDPRYPLGKYGRARLNYLKKHRPALYTSLLLSGKLNDDLHQTDLQAEHLLETMIPQMAREAGITETQKATDPMKWVGMMNAVKAQVEEIIYQEIVY